MAKRIEYKKAKTCKHSIKVSANGGVWIKSTCRFEGDIMHLPMKDQYGSIDKKKRFPYILAKHCEECSGYERCTGAKTKIITTKKVSSNVKRKQVARKSKGGSSNGK